MGTPKLTDRVRELNAKLTLCKLYVKPEGGQIYLRGMLPPRAGEEGPKRRKIPSGFKLSAHGLKAAFATAQQLEADLTFNRFDWTNWGHQPRASESTLAAWCSLFETDFFGRKGRSPRQLDYYEGQYRRAFRMLPLHKTPSCEIFKNALLELPATSRERKHNAISYQALAKFIGVDCDLSGLKGAYSGPEKRDLPSDTLIEQYREELLDREMGWRKVFELIALYGFRPHEILRLDFSRFHLDGNPIRVQENSKTGYRVAFPIPPKWVQEWKIEENPCLPCPQKSTSGLSNRELGQWISYFFRNQKKRHGWQVSPTIMRDMYAIRGARLGADAADVARWMGHSLAVHEKKYMVHIGERDDQVIWSRLPRR